MSSRLGRGALVIGALLIMGLLAVQLRGHELEHRAGRAVQKLSMGEGNKELARQAQEDIRDARLLRPDGNMDALRSYLLAASGRTRTAVAVAERLVRREPAHFNGWAMLYVANLNLDSRAARRAQRQALQVDPSGASTLYALASLPAMRKARKEASQP